MQTVITVSMMTTTTTHTTMMSTEIKKLRKYA